MKILRVVFALVALLAAFTFVPIAAADHPTDDVAKRGTENPNPFPDEEPFCDEENLGGLWGSLNNEIWKCVGEPGIPGNSGWIGQGAYWEPEGQLPAGGQAAFSLRKDRISIPGYVDTGMRLLSRTEWVNPTGQGTCPTAVGGCKLLGGADINIVKGNAPFNLHRTWFNHAMQLYVWNPTTKVWEKKHDTGWTMNAAGTPDYTNQLIGTYNYGTAPYGAAYYYVRGWARAWNGSTWATSVMQDPVNANGSIHSVWDPPAGWTGKQPPKPTKKPKLEKVKKGGFLQPPSSMPEGAAVDASQ